MYIYMRTMIQLICTCTAACLGHIYWNRLLICIVVQVAPSNDLIALSPVLKNCCYYDIWRLINFAAVMLCSTRGSFDVLFRLSPGEKPLHFCNGARLPPSAQKTTFSEWEGLSLKNESRLIAPLDGSLCCRNATWPLHWFVTMSKAGETLKGWKLKWGVEISSKPSLLRGS